MSAVTRLVTFVELDDQADDGFSVSARHELELLDGSRVLLLDDRGWGVSGPPGIWARTSVNDIAATTRMVVGPDEPFGDRTRDDMAADHWAHLQQIAQRQGAITTVAELRDLPHDVVLSPRLLARLAGNPLQATATAAVGAPAGAAESGGPRGGATFVSYDEAVPGIAPPGADRPAVQLDSAGRVMSHGQEPQPGHR